MALLGGSPAASAHRLLLNAVYAAAAFAATVACYEQLSRTAALLCAAGAGFLLAGNLSVLLPPSLRALAAPAAQHTAGAPSDPTTCCGMPCCCGCAPLFTRFPRGGGTARVVPLASAGGGGGGVAEGHALLLSESQRVAVPVSDLAPAAGEGGRPSLAVAVAASAQPAPRAPRSTFCGALGICSCALLQPHPTFNLA